MASDAQPTPFPRPDLLPERLADWIRGEIVAGRMAPGERLVEQALAKRCSVSRVPLREAMRIVAAQGLLTLEPHRGAVVTRLSESELIELFDLRMALEGFAAAAAARRDPKPDLAALHRLNDEMEDCIRAGDAAAYLGKAAAFHDALLAAAGNRLLIESYDRVKVRFRRYQVALSTMPELPPRSVGEHRDILDAITAGDADRARALAEDHIRDLVDAYRRRASDAPMIARAAS